MPALLVRKRGNGGRRRRGSLGPWRIFFGWSGRLRGILGNEQHHGVRLASLKPSPENRTGSDRACLGESQARFRSQIAPPAGFIAVVEAFDIDDDGRDQGNQR